MRVRFISELKKHILICAMGLAYYIWIAITNLYIPCVFRLITGLKCPGCGITHMIMAICRFDFLLAFQANPLLFVALPFTLTIYVYNRIHYIQTGTKIKRTKVVCALEYILLVLVVLFGITRNIPMN